MDRANSHTKSYNIPHSFKAMYINIKYELKPSATLIYFNDGRDGGGGPSDFLGSKILAKSDFFGSMKDAGIFWVTKKTRDFFGFQKKD